MIICDKCVHKMYCIDYGRKTDKCEYFDQMTEQEYIQTCDTEQLAEWIVRIVDCEFCPVKKPCKKQPCKKQIERWLKQPHTEKE